MAKYNAPESVHIGTGVETVFGFTWPVLTNADVYVTLNGTPVTTVIVSPNQISINPAPAYGAIIRIFRDTPAQTPAYLFSGGIPFLPRYVDANNKQLLYALQEGLLAFEQVAEQAGEAYNIALSARETAMLALIRSERSLRVPDSEAPLPPLQGIDLRAGKVLGFDSAGRPVATLPASGSGTELALDLAGPNGSKLVGHETRTVSDHLIPMAGVTAHSLGGIPVMGDAITKPQIYSGAGNATQGLSWFEFNGEEYMMISQRVSGGSWSASEMVRFSLWRWNGDGTDMQLVEFTQPLAVGHGSDITCIVEGSKIWIYTTMGNPGSASGGASNGGKGYSKVEWKGTATAQSDVRYFRVFGEPGEAVRYPGNQRASVCVSDDGKYVILVATSFYGTGRFFFVYDRPEVEATGGDARGVMPLIGPVPFERAPGSGGSTLQGMASDGVHLYTVWGVGDVRSSKSIQVYDMSGRLERTVPYFAAAAIYTDEELMGASPRGIPVSFEPEGLTLRHDEVLTLSVDAWKTPNDIVTYDGKNWACINTAATAGRYPWHRSNWITTNLPPTRGAYNNDTAYIAGPYTFREKRIMRLAAMTGAARELEGASFDTPTGTMKEYYAGTDIAWNAENGSFTFAKFFEALGTYKKFAEFNYDNTLNLFSTAEGTPNNRWVSIKSQWSGSNWGMELRSSGGNAAGGANIDLRAIDSPNAPGEAIVSSAGEGAVRLRTGSLTAMTLNPAEASFFVTDAVRAVTDGTVTLGAVSRNWKTVHSLEYCVGVSTCRIMSGIGSPEGVVAAQAGSLYLRRDTADNTSLWSKSLGTGNTGWRVVAFA